jgi:hypothetical protein
MLRSSRGGKTAMARRVATAFVLLFLGWALPGVAHEPVFGSPGASNAIGRAATEFLDSLSADQRAAATRPFDDEAARVNWSNLPAPMAPRHGVALADLSPEQRLAAHALLIASMSSQGYGKTAAIMWIDDILRVEEGEWLASANLSPEQRAQRETILESRSSGNYWIVVFGEPGTSRWGWAISGHHLAANFTVVDGRVAFTPLFLGAAPQAVGSGRYAGWRVLQHEIDRGFALAASLSEEQRRRVIIADAVTSDLFTGRGRKDSLMAPIGLPASQLDAQQQAQLWGLIREFVGDATDEAAAAQMDSIRADGLDRLHLAWWGPMDDPTQRFMYRIHGPSILIEYAREPDTRGSGGPGNHVHAIVRDPRNDYGEDWLGRHYTEHPH